MFHNIFSKKPVKEKQNPKIIADNREKSSQLIPILLEKNFQIEFKQLPVADYLINNVAIERKTISDLKSSIINKRIFQQLMELKQYKQHILIIEGIDDENIYEGTIHENALRGFLLAIALEFQTPTIFTQNAQDTANYLTILAKKKSNKEISIRAGKLIRSPEEQVQFILEGFPNIGPVKAKALLKEFKSIKNIINAPQQELEKILGKHAITFKDIIEKQHK